MLLACLLCGLALLAPATSAAAADVAIAQQFNTDQSNLTTGALVSLRKGAPHMVELATQRSDNIVGVLTDSPLLTVSDQSKGVQVVTDGVTPALVSDSNGVIKTGDHITISPIAGVGMKATAPGISVGIAEGDFNSKTADELTVKGVNGASRTVHIGLVPVQVVIGTYAAGTQTTALPSFLQGLANQVAGKQVSTVRILIASFILMLLFMTASVLMYGTVRFSIISIGRNPLAETALRKSLIEMGLSIGLMTLVSLTGVYLLLKL